MSLQGKFQRFFGLSTLVLGLALAAGAGAQGTTLSVDGPAAGDMIQELRFEGLKKLKPDEIRFYVRTAAGNPFSPFRLREDIAALLRAADRALADVQVEGEKGDKGWILIFHLVEKPKIKEVVFEGQDRKKNKELLEGSGLVVGGWADDFALREAERKIRALYTTDGFARTEVAASMEKDAEGMASIHIKIKESPKVKVAKIVIKGAKAFSADKVKGQFKDTHDGGILRSQDFHEEKFQEDLKSAQAFYQNQGYLEAKVEEGTRTTDEKTGAVTLEVLVTEGVRYKVGAFTVQGNVMASDEEISKALGLKAGDLFNKEKFDEGLSKAGEIYGAKGYIEVSISPEFKYRPEEGVADVDLDVSEGERAYIEQINFQGNYVTRDYVIRRDIFMKEGDAFDLIKLRRSVQNLYSLQYFDRIDFDKAPGSKPGQIILILKFQERKTGSISFGAGYSSIDKLVGFAKVAQINLFGRGQKVSLEWEFGKKRLSFTFSYEEPYLWRSRTGLAFGLWNTDRRYDTFDESRTGGNITVSRRFSHAWLGSLTYTLQDVSINTGGAFVLNNRVSSQNGIASSITPLLVFDNRDNRILPNRGMRHSATVDVVGGVFGGDFQYWRGVYDFSTSVRLVGHLTLGTHAKYGMARGYGGPDAQGQPRDVPLFDMFPVGGTDTVRGYDERVLGPIDPSGRTLPWGRAMMISNTELRYPIIPPFTLIGAAFLDGGRAWDETSMISGKNLAKDLDWGAGVGFRFTLPGTIMQLRFDYGWPFAVERPGVIPGKGKFHFTLGNIF